MTTPTRSMDPTDATAPAAHQHGTDCDPACGCRTALVTQVALDVADEWPEDDETPDLPLTAVGDLLSSVVEDVATALDTLPNLRHNEPSHTDTLAYDLHRRAAYLDAEEKVGEAWRALQHATQLVKGLAR